MAGEPGFEPGLTESESVGLPLTYSPTRSRESVAAGVGAFIYGSGLVKAKGARSHLAAQRVLVMRLAAVMLWTTLDRRRLRSVDRAARKDLTWTTPIPAHARRRGEAVRTKRREAPVVQATDAVRRGRWPRSRLAIRNQPP